MTSFVLNLLIAATTAGSTPQSGPPVGAFDPPPVVRHQLEEGSTKRLAYEEFRKARGLEAKNWADELPAPVIDVLDYEIEAHIDPSRQILSGSVTMTLTAVADGLTAIDLDADLGLRILSVLELGDDRFAYDTPTELAFEHSEDLLTVTLARPLAAGTSVRLQVTYGGHAWRGGLIGSTGVNWRSSAGTPVIHTFAQPYGARIWWPCNDRPDDKATVSLRVIVPEDLDVAANGLEVSRDENGDGTATSVWRSRYPVPTYLVAMHVSDFVYSESTYTGLDGTTMPVGLWAMPGVAEQAEADLAVTVPQIEVMAGHWGEYPFIEEKYGNATVFFGGGMEHQTMTTLAVSQVGNPWMEWLNVHELGHQWWGDWVTMDDWRHIWLNEGFATHTEWLWAEHLGPDVLADYLEDEDYLGQFRGSVYDNPEPFSWTIYAKGSWVAWMLRHVIGDDAFFEAMAAYRADHGGGTATTEDLKDAMEEAGDTTLDWFFDQWVYGFYRPRYVYSWENSGGPSIELTVRQVQGNTGLFRMPMDVRVTTTAGTENHRVWFEAEAEQTIEILLTAEATEVEIDPDTRVLCEIAHVTEPDLELGPNFPDGYDFGLVPGSSQATRTLPLTNTGGVDLIIEGIWLQSGSSFGLIDPPDFPLTIAAGESVTVEIEFDPSGFGRQTDWIFIQSNDPDRDGGAYLRLAGNGSLYEDARLVAPSSISVGRTAVGGTTEAHFDAINLGGQPLPIETAVEGPGFILGKTVPPVLAPGSSNEVVIRFHPSVEGVSTGSVIFHQGDPSNPLTTVQLTATGDAAPRLEITPVALSLGVGDGTQTATLILANSGQESLIVSHLEIDQAYGSDTPGLPFELGPGSSQPIEVGLASPSAQGTLAGHLTIHSNDPAAPVVRVPLRAHVSSDPIVEASFPAAASGPGLGETHWSTRAFLLNPSDAALQTDLVYRPTEERETHGPDVGYEVPPRSQRVIPNLVAATGASGSGGVNLTANLGGLVAVSRTFASGSGGTYGQFIGAQTHDSALAGDQHFLLAGLAGNGGFHTNLGILNLTADELAVDFDLFDASGNLVGSRRIGAAPGGFNQLVAAFSRLTDSVVRGGYATFTAVDPGARFLAYGSVVDDASHDPTLALPTHLTGAGDAGDQAVPAVASLPGIGGTTWRSQVDVVNTSDEIRSVTLEYVREDGSTVTGMAIELQPGATLHFDDVVRGLFGESGKGWLRVRTSGPGIHAASRTYNDDVDGTFGQLVPAYPMGSAVSSDETAVVAGLSSAAGFRTNLGLTSVVSEDADCTIAFFGNDGSTIGDLEVDLPAHNFIQLERVLAGEFGYVGEAWAEMRCDGPSASFFVHASVVDEFTGDPTYVPGRVINDGP